MSDPLASILATRGGLTFNQAFAAARARGDDTFEWMNPQTGKVGRYTTARQDDKRMRLPRGMKESDLYRDSRKEQPMRDSEARQRAIEKEYQQNLRNIRSEFETADKRDLQRYTSDMEPYEKQERDFAKHMEDMRRYEAREAIEGPMQEEYEREALANRAEMDRLRALQNQLQQEVYRNEQTSLQREIDENEQKVLQEWAAGKRKEQALERVYPEALAPVGRAAISTGKGLAAILDRLMRNQATQRQPMRNLNRQEPELNFAYGGAVNSMYAPSYAQGGLAGLAAQGRRGDSMLVHMSPDEVMNLQRMARMRGDTMTINPETGLPEAFKLRKLLRGLATLAPIAAAFFPPLAAAMPFLTTPLGAGLAGGVAGGLSGDKGFDLKRGLMGGALSYGLSSAMQGLKAAGGVGEAAAAGAPAGEFTAAEIAKMSPQAQAAIAGAPANYASLAAPGTEAAASMLGAQEAGIAGLRGVSGAPVVAPPPPMGSATQGIGNLLSSDAATRAAAQQAFTGQFGRGALMATGAGALGTMALDEQEKFAKQALAEGRIAQAEYDAMMARINAARSNAERAMQANPYRLYASGGDVGDDQEDPMFNPVSFRRGGLGSLPPRYIDGKGDGMSDSVPAVISNKQPARLADGEFVIPADVVSHLGNGSSKAGAKQLYSMMDRVRKARTGNPRQGKAINASRMMPA